MARHFWPAQTALGKRVALDLETMKFFPDRPPRFDLEMGMREIVGVWLSTPEGAARHGKRVAKLIDVEKQYLR